MHSPGASAPGERRKMTDESMSYLEALKEIKRLKEAMGKIKEELDRKHIHIIANAESQFHDGESYGIEEALVIIDKYTEGLV